MLARAITCLQTGMYALAVDAAYRACRPYLYRSRDAAIAYSNSPIVTVAELRTELDRVLADSARVFATRLVRDLEVDRERLAANVANALLLATALNPVLGYDKVARITAKAVADGTTPRDAAVALGFLTGAQYDQHVDPMRMIHPD